MALDSSVPFGVSPAWFISKFGEGFTLAQMVSQLPTIHSLGFDFWQPEVFRKEDLQSWTPGDISKLNRVQADLGVSPSQGVAHFLMNDFTSPDSLRAKVGLPYFRDLLAKAKTIDGFKRICFPLPPFIFSPGLDYLTSYEMLRSYVAQLLEMTQAMGFELTVEIMPGSLVQGTEGFLRLWNELGSPAHFGFCLDSGHVWGGREHLVSLPQR